MTILPLTYMGNIAYFSLLAKGDCVVDTGEHYVKQTYRNRCEILTANGPSALSVQVAHGGSGTKCPVRDMRVDYSKRWQHQHRMAIVSAYRNAPFFEHYSDSILPILEQRFEFLADLNLRLLEILMKHLKAGAMPRVSETFIAANESHTDLRGCFPLKKVAGGTAVPGANLCNGNAGYPAYWQVFSDRHAFIPNLSVLDLLMCEGPSSKDYLLAL